MRFTVGSTSDVGRVRSLNEDSLLTQADLFAVADGMGGHRGGEVASAEALAALRASFEGHDLDELVAAVQTANRAVFDKAQAEADLSGMGTTLCAVGVLSNEEAPRLGVVNVGDSRVYLHSDGQLAQLSEDHSFVEALVRDGRLTRAQADVHPQRNVLTRALGIEPEVQIDAWVVAPRDGDRFLLCSDGLFNEVADDEMAEVLGTLGDPDGAAVELVRRALESGGRDNITCVIVDVHLDDGTDDATLATEPSDRVVRHFDPTDDLAAFDDEQLSAAADIAPVEPPAAAPPVVSAGRSSRWRSVVFVGAIVGTLAVALGAVAWVGRNSYYVGFNRGEVVIYQGRPGGLLWFKPTINQHTGIKAGEFGPTDDVLYAEIKNGKEVPDVAAAVVYVSGIRSRLDHADTGVDGTAGGSTTTTSSTTTTLVATASSAPESPASVTAPVSSAPPVGP